MTTLQNGKRVRAKRIIKQTATAPFVLIGAVVILIEDWLWDDLARVAAFIGQLPILRPIELLISALPPYLALIVFAVPSVLLVPVKLLAVYLMAHGQATLGVLTVVAAKVFGTALIARIFTLTRPKLLHIPWFAWLHDRVVGFKSRVYTYLRSTAIYKLVHEQHLRMRKVILAWFGGRSVWRRRWIATMRLGRRRKQKVA